MSMAMMQQQPMMFNAPFQPQFMMPPQAFGFPQCSPDATQMAALLIQQNAVLLEEFAHAQPTTPSSSTLSEGSLPASSSASDDSGSLDGRGSVVASPTSSRAEKQRLRKARVLETRRVGVVSKVGCDQSIAFEDLGEMPFATRLVKKFPREPRTALVVGEKVLCKFAQRPEGVVIISVRRYSPELEDEPPALLEDVVA